jgi:hypothetical protein
VTLEIFFAFSAVILMASIAITSRVGVIAKEINGTATAFVAELLLCRSHQTLENSLPRAILRHKVIEVVALGCGIFGMASNVKIEARTIL